MYWTMPDPNNGFAVMLTLVLGWRVLALLRMAFHPKVFPPAHLMTEAELKREVMKLARQHGWKVYALPQTVVKRPMAGSTGYPDLTLARGGYHMWFELKQQGKEPTAEQLAWHEALGRGDVSVIHPVDLLDGTVEAVLRLPLRHP